MSHDSFFSLKATFHRPETS